MCNNSLQRFRSECPGEDDSLSLLRVLSEHRFPGPHHGSDWRWKVFSGSEATGGSG